MKFIRGALVVHLGLTCLIQAVEGIASIADPSGMMSGLNLAMSPGVEVPLTFLGLAMIARGAQSGLVLVTENQGIRRARFDGNGVDTDLGLTTLGSGTTGVVGAIAIQP